MRDIPLILILALLAATGIAWKAGWFAYPYGILVLTMALVVRIIQLIAERRR